MIEDSFFFSDYHGSNHGTVMIVFQTQYSSESHNFSTATLVEKTKPVTIGSEKIQYKDVSKLGAFGILGLSGFPRKEKNQKL